MLQNVANGCVQRAAAGLQRACAWVTEVAQSLAAAPARALRFSDQASLQLFLLLLLVTWAATPKEPTVTMRLPAGRRGKRRVGAPRTVRVGAGVRPSVLARLEAIGLGGFLLWCALTGALARGIKSLLCWLTQAVAGLVASVIRCCIRLTLALLLRLCAAID